MAVLLACALTSSLVAAGYVSGVLLPYVVNDLHHLRLSEVSSGAHDPKDLWPATEGTAGALLHAVGVFTALLGWVPLLLAGLGAGMLLRAAVRDRSRVRTLLATTTLVLVVATLATVLSPLGTALAAWKLD